MSLAIDKSQAIIDLVKKRFPKWSGFADPEFERQEIQYKQATIAEARELLSKDELDGLLGRAEFDQFIGKLQLVGQDNNLLWRQVPRSGDLRILNLPELNKSVFCKAVFDLLYGSGSSVERLGRYIDYVQSVGLPNYWTFPTYFLFVCHPSSDIFIKPTPISWFVRFNRQI